VSLAAARDIRIIGLPLDLHREASEHHAALAREFALLAAADPDDRSVPARLITLSAELSERFAGMADDAGEELASALASGAATVDLEYRMPPEVGPAAAQLDGLLDEADEFCRAGAHLLTLASPPESVAYRRWLLGQFIDQVEGAGPTSWRDWRARHADSADDPGDGAPANSGTTGIVRLPAELDLEHAPHVRSQLLDRIARGEVDLRLDGSEVTFIDSVGVSVLMAVYARCTAVGGQVRIQPASDRLRATLASVGVDDVLLPT
jgi:anti-anti-sigma factor